MDDFDLGGGYAIDADTAVGYLAWWASLTDDQRFVLSRLIPLWSR